MAGNSLPLGLGLIVNGKYGRYKLQNSIGHGGNGMVFAVEVIDNRGLPHHGYGYAIKVFDITPKDETDREYIKRQSRFRNEIEKVLSVQDKVQFIIPIYDASIYCEESQDCLWYLMPKAARFIPTRYSIIKKLEYMRNIGNCINQLHSSGLVHRDIKPNNLLLFNGQLCLADFGLVRDIESIGEQLTEINDRLGPQVIRPPELQQVGGIEGVDYKKSDVYLFAKTLWMILEDDRSGFSGEYSRTNDQIYIKKEKYDLDTAEPLHHLMEGATRHDWNDRIDLDTCLFYLEDQIRIIRNDLPQERLRDYKYAEQTIGINLRLPPDKKEYTDPSAVLTILNDLSGIVNLVFVEAGKEHGPFPLKKVKHIHGRLFEIVIQNPFYFRKAKTIEIAVESICLKKDSGFEMQIESFSFEDVSIPEYKQIIKALESTNDHIRLGGSFLIRMEK